MPNLSQIAWGGAIFTLIGQALVSARVCTAISELYCAITVLAWAMLAPNELDTNDYPAFAVSTAFTLIVCWGYGRNRENRNRPGQHTQQP
jgi:hypothetical protein